MKPIHPYLFIFLLTFFMTGKIQSQQKGLYPLLNEKSWEQILAENTCQWRPPYTVHLLIQPVHSPDWIYVNPSMTVSRRHVTENVSSTDPEKRKEANSQKDLVVQFAFDEPAFIPNFRLTNLHLAENKYPVATADYFANDVYYRIEYAAVALDSQQTLLQMNVAVKNEGEHEREVHVRRNIGYHVENQLFDYHYIPYNWTASKWKLNEQVSMSNQVLYKGSQMIGMVVPGKMQVEWEISRQNTDKQYEDVLYPQVWYGSGYALPEFRLKEIRNVVHASDRILPGDSTAFSIKLLVDDGRITPAHREALMRMDAEEIREMAVAGFSNQFADQSTAIDFSTGEWSDILTGLQLSTLQLLVRYPGKTFFQPAQGGSSERFYVWVFEAVQMLRPLLRTGQFEAVRKSLDYIFALQDGGYPPVGKFTTTEGSIGTTGPRWANTTGMALALACDYYLYSKDRPFIEQYLPKILKALRWITGEVKATRKLNPDGSRPQTYGLMPYAVASDGDEGYFVSATDIFSYWGFDKAVQLLESLNHPEAKEMRNELTSYREDLLIAIRHLARPDGYIDRKIVPAGEKVQLAMKFENTDIMAPIATTGIMDPATDIFQKYISYYENQVAVDYFMGKMDRDIFYIIQCEHYWQPIYLMLGEWKKAFMTLQTCLRYGMSQDTHQTLERFSKRDPAFAPWQPNGSGNGGVIDMLLNALYFETPEMVTLLGCVPFEYLSKNRNTKVSNLYTLTGKVNLDITMIDDKCCRLKLTSEQPLPAKIRIPAYFHAKAESAGVKDMPGGVFEVKKDARCISFVLHR